MQVLWKTTSDRYIADRAWIGATLQACPFHPEGGCGVVGHGSYPRVSPPGMRIPRFLCPVAKRTISLLPEFMACKLTGTLAELEEAVTVAEEARTQADAIRVLRPDDVVSSVVLSSAKRWLRRRRRWVEKTLKAAVTLLALDIRTPLTLAKIREHLAIDAVLLGLRRKMARQIQALAAPVGFGQRGRR